MPSLQLSTALKAILALPVSAPHGASASGLGETCECSACSHKHKGYQEKESPFRILRIFLLIKTGGKKKKREESHHCTVWLLCSSLHSIESGGMTVFLKDNLQSEKESSLKSSLKYSKGRNWITYGCALGEKMPSYHLMLLEHGLRHHFRRQVSMAGPRAVKQLSHRVGTAGTDPAQSVTASAGALGSSAVPHLGTACYFLQNEENALA